MTTSVRAIVEPYNTALLSIGELPNTIFLDASFSGLPLINHALAAENPLEGNGFLFTVQALIKVLGEIPPAAVLQAIADQIALNQPHPPSPSHPPNPPHGPTPPNPPIVTCSAEMDLGDPGFGGVTNMRIFGGGFVPSEIVDIIESGEVARSASADTFGNYSVKMGVLKGTFPTAHTVHAHGESSGRTSNNAGFTV